MTRRIFLAVGLLATTACFHIRYVTDAPGANTPADDGWHTNIIWGLVEVSPAVNVSDACPQGFAIVENEQTFVNGLVQWLLWSLLNPTNVTVTCAVPRVPQAASQPPTNPVSQAPSGAPANQGCTRDTDCKGTRICASGACVEPTR